MLESQGKGSDNWRSRISFNTVESLVFSFIKYSIRSLVSLPAIEASGMSRLLMNLCHCPW